MQLLLLRSGPAEPKHAWPGEDADRPLSAEGCALVADVAQSLARYPERPDLIVSSPYVRAQQTAQIVADILGAADRVKTDKRLAQGVGLKQLGKVLDDCAGCDVVMLVAHNPDLSDLVRELTGGGRLALRKAGVAHIEVHDPHGPKGRLLSLLVPIAMEARPVAEADAEA